MLFEYEYDCEKESLDKNMKKFVKYLKDNKFNYWDDLEDFIFKRVNSIKLDENKLSIDLDPDFQEDRIFDFCKLVYDYLNEELELIEHYITIKITFN